MKIVIDIDDEIYDFVQNTSFVEDENTLFKQTNAERQKTLALFDIIDAIRNGTPLPEWIPISERLPEDNIHVLCQFNLNGMAECYLAHGVFHIVGGVVMSCNEVLAWMPLPEPYKEKGAQDD